jgi:hypothetical protein
MIRHMVGSSAVAVLVDFRGWRILSRDWSMVLVVLARR